MVVYILTFVYFNFMKNHNFDIVQNLKESTIILYSTTYDNM